MLPTQNYTVLYATTPTAGRLAEANEYTMDLPQGVLHTDLKRHLKRDLSSGVKNGSNETLVEGPLFERYQFMGQGT